MLTFTLIDQTFQQPQPLIKSYCWSFQVGLFFDQLDGLESGYAKRTLEFPELKIPSGDFLWMNIDGDREDLEQVFNTNTSV